jgi:uncharacterized protein (TIGR02246 family)
MARKAEARTPRKAKKAPVKSASRAVKAARKPAPKKAPRAARKPRARARAAAPTSPAEDALAVEAFNRRYYDAFQALSPEEMAKVWWHDEAASCVHPGWDFRHGWPAVAGSFEEIFANTRSIRFALGDVRVRVVGDLAYVTCIENLVSEEQEAGDYLGAVLATNVYERRRGEWKMIHHHTSPFSSDEADIPEGPLH